MNTITLVSARSCTSSCWTAKQHHCRCSCHGINHGTFRRDHPSPPPDPDLNPEFAFQLAAFPNELTIRKRTPPTRTTIHTLPRPKRSDGPSQCQHPLITTPLQALEGPTMNRHLISVTHSAIAQGQKCNLRECALALAIAHHRDQGRPIFTNVFVALKKTRLNDHTFLDNSKGIQEWILNNDSSDTPTPPPTTIVVDLDTATLTLREEISS